MDVRIRRIRNDMANTLFHMQQSVEMMEEGKRSEAPSKTDCFNGNLDRYFIQRGMALDIGDDVSDYDQQLKKMVRIYEDNGGVLNLE